MEKDDNNYCDNDETSENDEFDEITSLMDQCKQTFGGKSKEKEDCIDQGKIAFKKFLKESEIPIEKPETIAKFRNTKLTQAQQLIKPSALTFSTPPFANRKYPS